MIRVTAPGLPPWPKLLFDPEKRRAIVSVRHPTWRSHEWAHFTTEVLVWFVFGLLMWWIWNATYGIEGLGRVFIMILASGFAYFIAGFTLRGAFRQFLARQVFATRTIIWFTEEAMAFRSRIYARPVVIWREWNDLPVQGRFVIHQDRDAAAYEQGLDYQKRTSRSYLDEAMMLEMIVTSKNQQSFLADHGIENMQRSIPITEISSRFAEKFTMVLAAAASLTGSTHEKELAVGTDLDYL